MNGYVIGGYLVVMISLGTYAVFLVGRLRAARRRLTATLPDAEERATDDTGSFR
ncbi:MAG TPA: hypothetical protein VIJ34_01630 [Acidimicrobiales bacterium]